MSDPLAVTRILLRASDGDGGATDLLFSLLYADLHGMAEDRLHQERRDHTLQATALVHEAYLRLVDQRAVRWKNRAHFLAVASRVMRRVLVDHARGKGRQKRGGGWQRVPLEETLTVGSPEGGESLLALEDALSRLERAEPEKARVVEMRFFGGLTSEECAEVLGVSVRTVGRYWDHAQAWLYREMTASDAPA